MADVFISYSRRDAAFVSELALALQARDKELWLDVRGITDGEVFPEALRRAIEESDGLIFVISEDAVASRFCRQEIDHAERLGKRIVPVLHRPVADEALPTSIRERQWVQAGEHLSVEATDRLVRALDVDHEHTRLHTRLLIRARDWDAQGRRPGGLPRADELAAAEAWLTRAPRNEPRPTSLHTEWIAAGRAAAARRQRRMFTAAGAFALVTLALMVLALVSRHDAKRSEASARSRAIAEESETQVVRDPQLALLLGRAALQAAPTPEAQLAVSAALDANTVRSQLPSFGVQGCIDSNYFYLLDGGRTAVDNTCEGDVVFADLVRRRIFRRVHVGNHSTDMTISPDKRTLTVAADRNLIAVDVRTGATRTLYTAPWPIKWTAVGPPGRFLAIGDAERIGLVDLKRRRLRLIAHGDASANLIFGMLWTSPDVLLVVSSGQSRGRGDLYGGVTLLDVVHGTRRTVRLAPPSHLAAVSFLGIARDLRTWYITGADIAGTSDEQVAMTWAIDARTRRVRWTARGPMGAAANPVVPSADGRLVSVGYSQGAVDVLDGATGRLVVRDSSSSSIVAGWMAFPPGNRSLITLTLDGVFRTWATRGSEQQRIQAPDDPAMDFTPDGRALVLVGDRGQQVDPGTGRVTRRFPGFPAGSVFNFCNAACFAATPGLRRLTYVDPTSPTPRIVEIDGRTGRRLAAVTVPRLDAQGVSPDGRIVAAYVDGDRLHARLIDPRSGAGRDLSTGASSASCFATTPAFTPDSRRMAIVDGCLHVVVWDLRSGRVIRTTVLPDRAAGAPARLTPDGRYVLVTVEGGGLARLDVASGRVAERPGSESGGNVLVVSPDGRWYAIGRQNGTVDEYDARSLRLVRHHSLVSAIESLAFSPDSRRLAVEDTAHVVRVWDSCAICEDPLRLSTLAARESVRKLTPGERATFDVP